MNTTGGKTLGELPRYDLVQCGYPLPDHGEMILREGGTDAFGNILPSEGEWIRADMADARDQKLLDLARDLRAEADTYDDTGSGLYRIAAQQKKDAADRIDAWMGGGGEQ